MDMEDLKDAARFMGGLLLAVAALFAVILGILAGVTAYQCDAYQGATGRETKYVAMECYVQDGGSWYAWTEYKYRLATKGEFTRR